MSRFLRSRVAVGRVGLAVLLAAGVLAPGVFAGGGLVAQTTTATTLPVVTLSLVDSSDTSTAVTALDEDSGSKALQLKASVASAPGSGLSVSGSLGFGRYGYDGVFDQRGVSER